MKWFFKKTRPLRPPNPEGQAAHHRAMEKIAEIDARWVAVRESANAMRSLREENHFAEQIQAIFAPPGRRR